MNANQLLEVNFKRAQGSFQTAQIIILHRFESTEKNMKHDATFAIAYEGVIYVSILEERVLRKT